MRTTDWKFDFSSLPHWDNRNSFSFVYDEFYEIPQSDTLCCIYSIVEASMCNYVGFLAILKTKENPQLYLNIAEEFVFCTNFSASKNGDLIFLQPSIYDQETNRIKRPILIIDVCKNVFSYIYTDNYNPGYEIIEINKTTFKVKADEVQKKNNKYLRKLERIKIRTRLLKWRDLEKLNSLPGLIFKK